MAADFCRQYLQLLAIPAGQTAQTIDTDSRIQLERRLCAYVDSVSHRIRFLLSRKIIRFSGIVSKRTTTATAIIIRWWSWVPAAA